jgi:hypothetical protein
MTIDEAIKYSGESVRYLATDHKDIHAKAVALGIEALKAWKFVRADRPRLGLRILPGETEE